MVRDALASDPVIAMVQPKDEQDPPSLFEIGCLGRIVGSEELEDGRFNIVLEGIGRFRIAREAEVETPYRQVDADLGGFRSEEHTSELQSLMRISYAVFCLKKKKIYLAST